MKRTRYLVCYDICDPKRLRSVAKVLDRHRDGLGPAEEEVRSHQEEKPRHDNGAEGVDVRDRVERQAPEHAGGGVAPPLGNQPVRALVHDDREQQDREEQQRFGHRASETFEGIRGASEART